MHSHCDSLEGSSSEQGEESAEEQPLQEEQPPDEEQPIATDSKPSIATTVPQTLAAVEVNGPDMTQPSEEHPITEEHTVTDEYPVTEEWPIAEECEHFSEEQTTPSDIPTDEPTCIDGAMELVKTIEEPVEAIAQSLPPSLYSGSATNVSNSALLEDPFEPMSIEKV